MIVPPRTKRRGNPTDQGSVASRVTPPVHMHALDFTLESVPSANSNALLYSEKQWSQTSGKGFCNSMVSNFYAGRQEFGPFVNIRLSFVGGTVTHPLRALDR